jgi:hypothetical protein
MSYLSTIRAGSTGSGVGATSEFSVNDRSFMPKNIHDRNHNTVRGSYDAVAERAGDGVFNGNALLVRKGTFSDDRVDAVASRTFHLSTNSPSRNDFVNAVRNNPSAKAQLKEVISQLFHQEFNMLRLTFC